MTKISIAKRYAMQKWLFISIFIFLLNGCGNNKKEKRPLDNTPLQAQQSDSGLTSATNRKAIIAQLGKNFQNSQSGQYRQRVYALAPFSIKLVDGNQFTYKDLDTNKAVTLIYFSPSCKECNQFTQNLLKKINSLKDRQLIFITYEDIRAVKSFYKSFNLSKYPQIKMGTEGYKFTVQKYYKIQHFPFVATYDKTGHLIQIYSDVTNPAKLAASI